MKTKLLLTFLSVAYLGYSQAPINNYFATSGSDFAIVTGTVDQTPTGANATWNFSSLTQAGTNTDTYANPTAGELTSYPGTTQVLTITDNAMNTNQLFYNQTGSTLSLTGAANASFTLDYNTDNALIGSYPLTFGAAATVDNIAGTLSAQGQTPSYTGNITTEVDAYGTLSFDVTGQGSYTGSVTRVRTVQNISFTVIIFPGTGVITTTNYYKDSDGSLVFRTTDGVVSVPAAGITETITTREALITNTLSVDSVELVESNITLYPNPTEAVLNIKLNQSFVIQSLKIMDINGRVVLSSNTNGNNIDVSQLQDGFYVLKVSTNKGEVTKKFIKK